MSTWRYVHASITGSAHHSTDRPCQDAHRVRLVTDLSDPLLLLVTSDGAGSALHSEEGSQLVCEEVLREMERWLAGIEDRDAFLERYHGVTLVNNLLTILTNYAEEHGYALRDLASTLNAAAITPNRQWFLQVGDGATVIQTGGGVASVVSWPDNGEYANQTYFVTDVPDEHIHVVIHEGPLERIALLTDGLQSLALSMKDKAPHAPFFEPMFRTVEAWEKIDADVQVQLNAGLAAFLDSAAVNARTSDDKTLIIASCRPVSGGASPE